MGTTSPTNAARAGSFHDGARGGAARGGAARGGAVHSAFQGHARNAAYGPFSQTTLCNYMYDDGVCNIPNCQYAHPVDIEAARWESEAKGAIRYVCRKIMKRGCTEGEKCLQLHTQLQSPRPPANVPPPAKSGPPPQQWGGPPPQQWVRGGGRGGGRGGRGGVYLAGPPQRRLIYGESPCAQKNDDDIVRMIGTLRELERYYTVIKGIAIASGTPVEEFPNIKAINEFLGTNGRLTKLADDLEAVAGIVRKAIAALPGPEVGPEAFPGTISEAGPEEE